MSEPWDLRTVPWRTGRHVGRTIYACPPGSSYRYGEGLIGMMDTLELAEHVVEIHNWWLQIRQQGDETWAEMQRRHSDGEADAS